MEYEILTVKPLDSGTCNDNPVCLVEVAINGVVQYVCGHHGVDYCAVSDAIRKDLLWETAEEAVKQYRAYSAFFLDTFTIEFEDEDYREAETAQNLLRPWE